MRRAVVFSLFVIALFSFGPSATSAQPSCCLTQGYWKNHVDQWNSTQTFFCTGMSWEDVLNTPVGGNPYLDLAHQWIAASLNLNVIGGTGTLPPSNIAAEYNDGLNLLSAYCINETIAPNLQADATNDATVLNNFNNGQMGIAHCSSFPTTTPSPPDATTQPVTTQATTTTPCPPDTTTQPVTTTQATTQATTTTTTTQSTTTTTPPPTTTQATTTTTPPTTTQATTTTAAPTTTVATTTTTTTTTVPPTTTDSSYVCRNDSDCNEGCSCINNSCSCQLQHFTSGGGVSSGGGGDGTTGAIVGGTLGGLAGLTGLVVVGGLVAAAVAMLIRFFKTGQVPGNVANMLHTGPSGDSLINPLHEPQYGTGLNALYVENV